MRGVASNEDRLNVTTLTDATTYANAKYSYDVGYFY